MATFTGSIVIDLKSNLVQVGKRINRSLKKTRTVLKRTAKGFREASAQASKLGKNTEKLRQGMKRLSVVSGVALAAGLAKSIQIGSDFETALGDLSSITGSTGDQLEFLRQKSVELGKDGVVAAARVADAFKLVASANSDLLKDPEALTKVTESVILLANASGLELTAAASSATQAMNQFGLGADDALRAVNVLAAGAKIGASEVNETAQALIKAGSAAKLAGVSFESTNAAIQVLAKGGIKGAEAGTQLKNVFLKLEASGNKNLMPSIIGINKALENLSDANLNAAELTGLFGLESVSAAKILIDSNKRLADWTKQMTGTNIAVEQARIRLATFGKQMEKVRIIVQNKLIKVFDRLRPKLIELKDQFVAFLDTIKTEDIDRFVDSILGVFNALGGLKGILKIVGAILAFKFAVGIVQGISALIALGKVLKLATAAQWLLNIALGANPIGAVILAIGALIAIGVLLVRNWDTVTTIWDDWNIAITSLLGPMGLMLNFIFRLIKNGGDLKATFIGIFDDVKKEFLQLTDVLPDFIKKRIGIDVNTGSAASNAGGGTTAATPAQALATAAPLAPKGSKMDINNRIIIEDNRSVKVEEGTASGDSNIKTSLGITTPIGATG